MNNLSKAVQDAIEQLAAPSVLTWKSKKIEGALITKIGSQRYLGVLRQDKKGQDYWRYHLLTNDSESSANPRPISEASSSANPAQAEQSPGLEDNQAVEESERSPDTFSPEKGLEESEAVKKFREKYGTPSNHKASER